MKSSLVMMILVGCVGGWLGHWSKLPSGVLLGSLAAVIAFKLLGPEVGALPSSFKFGAQVCIGILIGAGFHRSMIPQLQKLWIPVVVSALLLMVVGILTSIVMAKMGVLDLATSYLSTSPGGMTALVTIAFDTGAAAPLVTLFHFTRILLVVFTAPLVLRFLQSFL
ncbi:MAG: hypothetical protein EP343_02300 [Deltaproteobacteria bacterium]|nr:MAG: hypothetical protein EP343_02300 [Deltaproteobacteria bacterium]